MKIPKDHQRLPKIVKDHYFYSIYSVSVIQLEKYGYCSRSPKIAEGQGIYLKVAKDWRWLPENVIDHWRSPKITEDHQRLPKTTKIAKDC